MFGLKSFYIQKKITIGYVILFPILLLLSWIYAGLLRCVKFLYRIKILTIYRSAAKVISVGNITLGGSGKTPLVEYIASQLMSRGHRVTILLRGYQRPLKNDGIGSSSYYAYGDEASMLEQNLSPDVFIAVGRQRAALAKNIDRQKKQDTLILDDGFQHWSLARDLDIVALDATCPFGNGLLLPAGHLREEVGSLKRAHVFCLTRCDEAQEEKVSALENDLKRLNPSAMVVRTIHGPAYLYDLKTKAKKGLEILKNANIGILCGIANPNSFIRAVQRLGSFIVFKKIYQDHHHYSEKELLGIFQECQRAQVDRIVTTEKDAQRLVEFIRSRELGCEVLALKVAVKIISGQEALHARLDSLYLA